MPFSYKITEVIKVSLSMFVQQLASGRSSK